MLIPLDTLDILAIVDNETDPMSPAPPCVTATGRLGEVALGKGRVINEERGAGIVKELAMEQLCCGAHGLSLMITGTTNTGPQTLLFDTGPTESIWTANAARLSPALHTVSLIHLSHWHRDHSGGMLSALRVITEAKLTAGLLTLPSSSSLVPLSAPTTIIDLHPARPNYRGFITPLGIVSLEADPTFPEIEAAGGTVEKHAEAHEVLDSYFLISGEIPRVTEYEKGVRAGLRFEDGAWITDELILDERFVVCHVKDKGLVLFTGCSHAGLINAALHSLTLTGNTLPLYAIVGGYHLADAEPAILQATVQELKKLDVKVLIAGHCTGWRAKFEIEKEMPGCLVPSFVGIKTRI